MRASIDDHAPVSGQLALFGSNLSADDRAWCVWFWVLYQSHPDRYQGGGRSTYYRRRARFLSLVGVDVCEWSPAGFGEVSDEAVAA